MAVERLVWQDVSGSRAPFALTGFAPIFSPLSSVSAMIEAIRAITLASHDMSRAVSFYLEFELLPF
jgi:hypothetical protein